MLPRVHLRLQKMRLRATLLARVCGLRGPVARSSAALHYARVGLLPDSDVESPRRA